MELRKLKHEIDDQMFLITISHTRVIKATCSIGELHAITITLKSHNWPQLQVNFQLRKKAAIANTAVDSSDEDITSLPVAASQLMTSVLLLSYHRRYQ